LAELLVYWGWLLIRLGRLDEAETMLQKCQAFYAAVGQSFLPGYGTDPAAPLSLIATIRGDYETAVAYGKQSVAANRTNSHTRNLYNAYYVLTSATVAQGDYAAAQQYAQQAYTLIKQADDRWFMAYVRIEMGKIALALDDVEAAQEHFAASYQLRQAFEDPEGMAITLTYLGQVLLQKQAYDEAQTCFQQSLAIYKKINDRGGLARTYLGLGQIACGRGDFQAGRQYLHQALALAADMNFVPLLFATLNAMGELFMQTGQSERGLALFAFVSQQPASDQAARAEANRQLHEAEQGAETKALAIQANQQAQTLTDVLNDLLGQWGSFDGLPAKEKQEGGG
jgi:tetratricopeptide (TPR) repeat protein